MNNTPHLFLAKRENNPKRDFIILNTRQAKHFPSDPAAALELMETLGQRLAGDGRAEKPTVIIGFAETATAIGAVVAGFFHDCFYVTTTREQPPDWATTISFEESHSHASHHTLCVRDEDIFRRAAQVILVDDEFTTGSTAVHLLKALDGCLAPNCRVYAAALAASSESIEMFSSVGITPITLSRLEDMKNRTLPEHFSPDRYFQPREFGDILHRNSLFDQRLGVPADLYLAECRRICTQLAEEFTPDPEKTVEIIGTEEFCYPPLLLGKLLSGKFGQVVVHCVTRSPMLPFDSGREPFAQPEPLEYPLVNRTPLKSVYDPKRQVFLYNTQPCDLSIILTDAEAPDETALRELCGAVGGREVMAVCFHGKKLPTSYLAEDVQLLLTDITGKLPPLAAKEREKLIQSGTHYSELLPAEYEPSPAYFREYERGLEVWAKANAEAVQTVAEAIWAEKGRNAVLVSLARAGTPAGVLIKRYIRKKYGVSLPHYSISIIVGRGIDRRAMEYILARHPADGIQFIDGWTGKGMITRTLRSALEQFPLYEYGIGRDKLDRLCEIAVLADPAGLCRLCGTHDDLFIPCACLNSVVSGLFSRTVLKDGLIQPEDFHGAAYFGELAGSDRTYQFIETVEQEMQYGSRSLPETKPGSGLAETQQIAAEFGISNIKLVKPSIGETTRVLLRRIPDIILLRDLNSPLTRHIVELAQEKGVEVREYPLKNYCACGIIKVMDNV
ncbi:MAG: phosphoribosyltransferase domain-containing protein [Oscillospiraceae bacterium]